LIFLENYAALYRWSNNRIVGLLKLMDESHPLGNFDLFADGLVSGWLTDHTGDPIPVAVKVNGVVAATSDPNRPWPWTRRPEKRGQFEVRLHLKAGDRIEIFNALTGQQLKGVMRRVGDPRWRPRVALIAPIKQEAPYLLEWIAFHRALGVETFVLADNGGTDLTSELLQALDAAGLITRFDLRGQTGFQLSFDLDAVRWICGRADVCCITDADEFIRPLGGLPDIPTAMAEIFSRPEISAAALNWASYGSSGRVEPGEGLVIERFIRRAPDDDQLNLVIKSVVRPEQLSKMIDPHVARLIRGEYVNDAGAPVEPSSIARVKRRSWNKLRVDHFVVKSRHEFEIKARRGRPDAGRRGVNPRDETFFMSHDSNDVLDPMPEDFVARTKTEMARICALLRNVVPSATPTANLILNNLKLISLPRINSPNLGH
jgi:hypothetical protein